MQEKVNGHSGGGLGTDLTKAAAENASYSEPTTRDSYAFSGREIRETFLTDGRSIGDSILRSHFEADTHHLTAMQFEQGLRVLRRQAKKKPGDLPDRVKEYAVLPPALQSAMVGGYVSAAKDGLARSEALIAWSGGSMMMANKRGPLKRLFNPDPNGRLQ